MLPHIQAGKLRALAAASARRGRITADLPTIAESGLPGYDVSTWNAIVLPAGVSTELVARIHTAVVGIFTTPEVRDRFAKQGIEVDPSSPADLAALIRSEYERYGQLVKRTGIKGERE